MKKEFKKPIAEMIAMETISNILQGSTPTPGTDGSGDTQRGHARNATGSITPTTSSEAFGD